MAVGWREIRPDSVCYQWYNESPSLQQLQNKDLKLKAAVAAAVENGGELFYDFNEADFARDLHHMVVVSKSEQHMIHKIVFGPTFNRPILKTSIPPGVSGLVFGAAFNQTLDGLPASVQHLTFGEAYNQPLETLPITIKRICLLNATQFSQSLKNMPKGVVCAKNKKLAHTKRCHNYTISKLPLII